MYFPCPSFFLRISCITAKLDVKMKNITVTCLLRSIFFPNLYFVWKGVIYAPGVNWDSLRPGIKAEESSQLWPKFKDTTTHLWNSLFSRQQAASCHTPVRWEADSPASLVVANYAPHCGKTTQTLRRVSSRPGNHANLDPRLSLWTSWTWRCSCGVLVKPSQSGTGARIVSSERRSPTDLWCSGHVETVGGCDSATLDLILFPFWNYNHDWNEL